jgi:hypothetical protein
MLHYHSQNFLHIEIVPIMYEWGKVKKVPGNKFYWDLFSNSVISTILVTSTFWVGFTFTITLTIIITLAISTILIIFTVIVLLTNLKFRYIKYLSAEKCAIFHGKNNDFILFYKLYYEHNIIKQIIDSFETKHNDKWPLYDHFWPFFAIWMFIFHKTEIQTVILRSLTGLNLNWFKS